jgi:hypothetical protein
MTHTESTPTALPTAGRFPVGAVVRIVGDAHESLLGKIGEIVSDTSYDGWYRLKVANGGVAVLFRPPHLADDVDPIDALALKAQLRVDRARGLANLIEWDKNDETNVALKAQHSVALIERDDAIAALADAAHVANGTESTPTTEPAESLDDLRMQLVRARIDRHRAVELISEIEGGRLAVARAERDRAVSLISDLEDAIASAEADEQDCNHDDGFSSSAPDASQVPHGPKVSPYPCPASGSPLYCECDGRGICKGVPQPAPQPTPFDERALADTDAIIDMTGMAVTSTAAVLAIRAAVQYRADQAQARYLAAQHGSYEVGRGRAMVARDTWREALALVDTVIAERMS